MNPWKNFTKLMSDGNKWLGKISFIYTYGKVAVNPIPTATSSAIVVESNGAGYFIDDYVWVSNGIVLGKAPNIKTELSMVIY